MLYYYIQYAGATKNLTALRWLINTLMKELVGKPIKVDLYVSNKTCFFTPLE